MCDMSGLGVDFVSSMHLFRLELWHVLLCYASCKYRRNQEPPTNQCSSRLKPSMPFKRAFALPNIPLSLKLALQNATPNLKLKTSLEVLNKNLLATRINERRAFVTTRSGARWFILNSSHYNDNMYRIIHTQVWYEFCISFLYTRIDVLDLNQPFNWMARVWDRALQNETHTRASISTTASNTLHLS